MKTIVLSSLTLFGVLLLAGCAQTFHFRVDALADPGHSADGERFVLEDANPGAPGASLRFREASDFVGRALMARGYELAPTAENADLIISLSARVSDPLSDTERRMEPVYYRTWGRSEVIRTPVVDSQGRVRYISTHVYIPPETHFAGYTSRDRSVVVYEKSLELTARTQEGAEVWTVRVTTLDRNSDLRASIPYLAAAATPYLGQSTEGSVAVRLKEDDDMVRTLRGMPSATR